MTWRVAFAPAAAAQVRVAPPDLKRSIKAALRLLSDNPRTGKALVRELAGLYSYRVRRYRIIYALDDKQRRLLVIAVGHRADIYRGL